MTEKNKTVTRFIELTDKFEFESSELMSDVSLLSENDKKEIIPFKLSK